MRMSKAGGRLVIATLVLSAAGACGGGAVVGPDQAGLVNQGGGGGACACGAPSEDVAQQALACLCGTADAPAPCTATLSAFDPSAWCETTPMAPTLRTTGCGRVTYIEAFGYGASEVTFDATTGAVVGETLLTTDAGPRSSGKRRGVGVVPRAREVEPHGEALVRRERAVAARDGGVEGAAGLGRAWVQLGVAGAAPRIEAEAIVVAHEAHEVVGGVGADAHDRAQRLVDLVCGPRGVA